MVELLRSLAPKMARHVSNVIHAAANNHPVNNGCCTAGSGQKTARRVPGKPIIRVDIDHADLQAQYTNYKSTLQSLAQKAGEIEQEIEEHK